MTTHHAALVDRLARFPAALRAAVSVFGEVEIRWKPAPEHWSVLEVVCHLADEEAEDFAIRFHATLAGGDWPPLDFDDIAQRRGYNARDLAAELTRFESLRRANVARLRGLFDGGAVDLKIAHQHPKFGAIPAGDLLFSWGAHDALHLRQIAKRLHNLAQRDAGVCGFSVAYAGDWSA